MEQIPKLIENIRKYSNELTIDKEDNININEQVIYGNKIGQWIGEIIHNRLLYLQFAKSISGYIIISDWDTGILPHIGRQMFINKLKQYLNVNNFSTNNIRNINKLLSDIWTRLESCTNIV